MKKKQAVAILLAGMMLSSSTIVWANSYQDTQGHWAEKAITTWSDRSVLNGYNGLFRPNDTITRGEMAVILDRIMYYTEKQQNTFADLDQAFYTDSILKAAKAGILVGADGLVRPKDSITRQEAIIMLAKALSIEPVEGSTNFTDDSSIADWAKGYVVAMQQKGYMSNYTNSFSPSEPISRAEVATLLDNSIENVVTEDISNYTVSNKDVIMNTADTTLKDSIIERNLILAEGIGEGDVTLDNVTVKGALIIRGGGVHSVNIKNSNIANVSVEKKSSPVRVVAEQGSTVTKTNVTSSSILEGNFNNVAVSSPVDVTVRGNVEAMEVSAKANLQSESGTIKSVNITSNGAGAVVKGAGSVQNVTVGAESVSVETANTNVTVANGVSKATVGGKTTSGGTQTTTTSTSSSSSSSSSSSNKKPSSSGGGSSSSGGSSSGGSSSNRPSGGGSSSNRPSGGGGSSSGGSSSGGSGSDTNQVSDIQIRNVESVSNSLVRVSLSKKTKEPLTLSDFSIICTGGGSNMTILNVKTTDNRTYELTTAYYKDNTYNLQININGKYANKDFVVKYDCAELTSQTIKRTGETTAEFVYVSDAPGTLYYAVVKDSAPVLAAYNSTDGTSVRSVMSSAPTAEQLVSSGTASTMVASLNEVNVTGLQKDTAYTFYYMAVDVDGRMTPVRQMEIGAEAPQKPKPPVKPSNPSTPDNPDNPTTPEEQELKIVSFTPHENELTGPAYASYDYWYIVELNKAPETELADVKVNCPRGNISIEDVSKAVKVDEKTYKIYIKKGTDPNSGVFHTITMTFADGTEVSKRCMFDFYAPVITGLEIERTDENTINATFDSDKAGLLYYKVYNEEDYEFGGSSPKDPADIYATGEHIEIKKGVNSLKEIEASERQRFCYATELASGVKAAAFFYSKPIEDYDFVIENETGNFDTNGRGIERITVTYQSDYDAQMIWVTFNQPIAIDASYTDNLKNYVSFEGVECKINPGSERTGDDGQCIGFFTSLEEPLLPAGEHTIYVTLDNFRYKFNFTIDANGNTPTASTASIAPAALILEDAEPAEEAPSDNDNAEPASDITKDENLKADDADESATEGEDADEPKDADQAEEPKEETQENEENDADAPKDDSDDSVAPEDTEKPEDTDTNEEAD